MNRSYPSRTGFEKWRLIAILSLILLVFGFYSFRLFSLQVINGNDYLTRSEDNRKTIISEPTQRGIVYDRNGFVLARNVASYNITITPADLPSDAGSVQEVYRQLSALIGIPVSQGNTDDETVRLFKPCDNDLGLTQIVYIQDTNAPYTPVSVKCNVDQKMAMTIRERAIDLPGVGIDIVPVREYPTGILTSEIIGFLGPITEGVAEDFKDRGFVVNRDKMGFAGIELSMNDDLMGINGKRVVERDVAGQIQRDLEPPVNPEPGHNIRLTIDTRLQSAAQAALQNQINGLNRRFPEMGLNTGVVIAMNPKTGEILAMVSLPKYENNRMARQIPSYYYNQLANDPTKPLLNHAVSSEFPPGSVYKLVTSLGILNEGVISPTKTIDDPGRITLEEKFSPNAPGKPRDYVCYTYKTTGAGHGAVDFLRGISQSCDVYFYKVAGGYKDEVPNGGLGILRMKQYALALGYGAKSGIELPGETKGVSPDPTWKRLNQGENWSSGDTYISAIGQGYVTSTPLQVLVSMATIANDGKQMQPTLIREITDSEGKVIKPFTPVLKHDLTKEPLIGIFDDYNLISEKKAVDPGAVALLKQGLRKVIVDGTGAGIFEGFAIPSAGKTGTAEYCDNIAQAKNRCSFGNWPAHAWYAGFAPYDDPEIAVVAFVYNGNEGSTTSGPVVRQVMEAYFDLKANTSTQPVQK